MVDVGGSARFYPRRVQLDLRDCSCRTQHIKSGQKGSLHSSLTASLCLDEGLNVAADEFLASLLSYLRIHCSLGGHASIISVEEAIVKAEECLTGCNIVPEFAGVSRKQQGCKDHLYKNYSFRTINQQQQPCHGWPS